MEINQNIKEGTYSEIKTLLKIKENKTEELKNFEIIITKEIEKVSQSLIESVRSKHPVLDNAASYFFNMAGKKNRPLIILLISHTLNYENRSDLLVENHFNLSEIVELIHVASLIHDDIIDESSTRRGVPSLHSAMGNKIAVLAGDFLLARASIKLTLLENIKVIRLISTIIEHLAHGEGKFSSSFKKSLSNGR
jgi:all-trans-nonaprenyl-diphosphate synthase